MAIWLEHINLQHVWNHDEPWQTVRDNVIPIIKASKWYQGNMLVEEIVQKLEQATDVESFDEWWGYLYDEADEDAVWIGTS